MISHRGPELRAAKAEVESASAERSKVEALFFKEKISANRFGELHQALDQKLEHAAARVDSLEKDLAALPRAAPPDVGQITQALPERWKKLSPKEARKLTRAFVERITLGEDDIEISFWFSATSPKVVASGQQTSAPTKASAVGLKPGDPVYVRLPKSGQRCPHSGLTRSKMNELILPSERNNYRPPVESKSLRQRGSERGIRLILLESLLAHVADHA